MRRQPRGPSEQPCEVIRAYVRRHPAKAAVGQRADDGMRPGVARWASKFRRRVCALVAHASGSER